MRNLLRSHVPRIGFGTGRHRLSDPRAFGIFEVGLGYNEAASCANRNISSQAFCKEEAEQSSPGASVEFGAQ